MYRTTQLQSLTDVTVKDEAKLKAAQDLSDNLDMAIASAEYPRFLEIAMKVFVKILQVCLLGRYLRHGERLSKNGLQIEVAVVQVLYLDGGGARLKDLCER